MMNDIFQRALGITSPWFIKSINFDENIKRLDIEVDFKRGATFIDDTEDVDTRKPYTAYDTIDKTWRHLSFFSTHAIYMRAFQESSELMAVYA